MKHLPIVLLLAAVAGFGAFSVRSHRKNLALKSKATELAETVESYKCLVGSRDEALSHSRLGTSVLCRMAVNDAHNEVFSYLDMTPAGSLNCKLFDLAELPETTLLCYSQKRDYERGKPIALKETRALLEKSKTVFLLVDFKSLEVVDHILVKNCIGLAGIGPPYRYSVSCNLPDGTPAKYKVLATGFERIQ